MKKQLVIIGIIAILVTVELSGCQTESEEDGQFKANLYVSREKLNTIQDNIMDAVNNQDMTSFQSLCTQLKINAKASTEMIKNNDISSKFQSAKTEYLAYLDDLWYAGYYGEQGDADSYIDYYSKAVAHYTAIDLP